MTKKPKEPPASVRGLALYVPELGDKPPENAQTVLVPLESIVVPPEMLAHPLDKAAVDGIARSVRAGGLHEPITVHPADADGKHVLVFGRHRLEAHRLLGLAVIPAVVRKDLDVAGVHAARVVENLQRRRLPLYEEATGYQRMREAGLTAQEIAVRVGVSEPTVHRRLKLAGLPPEIGALVDDDGHGLGQEGALELAKLVEAAPETRPIVVKALTRHKGKVHDPLWTVQGALQEADMLSAPHDPQFHAIAEKKAFKLLWADLHQLGAYVVDPGRARHVAALDMLKQHQEDEAKKYARTAKRVKEGKAPPEALAAIEERRRAAREGTQQRLVQIRARTVLVKGSAVASKERVDDMLLRFLADQVTWDEDFADRLHVEFGVPLKPLRDAAGWYGQTAMRLKALQAVEEAKGRDVTLKVAAALAARMLLEGERGSRFANLDDEKVVEMLAGTTVKDLTRAVKEELRAQEKEPKPRIPWQETPRAVACEGCGAPEKKECIGPTGHVMKRAFHGVRVAAFQALGAQAATEAAPAAKKRRGKAKGG